MSEQPQPSVGRTIARNTLFSLGAQIVLRVVNFLFQVLVIRRLGPESFGQYAVVLAWAGIFSVLGDMGIAQYMTREISRERGLLSELFWDVTALRFLLAIVAAVITTTGAIINGYDTQMVIAIAIYTSSYFLQALLAPLAGVIYAHERLDVVSLVGIVGQILFMVAGGLFLVAGFDFIWLVIAAILNLPILIIFCVVFIRRNQMSPPRFRINRQLWWGILRAGLPFAFVQLSLSFAFQIDTVFLENYYRAEIVAWYNVAYSLIFSLMFLGRAFNQAILPTLAREHAKDPKSIHPWYYRSVKIMLMLGLPMAVGVSLLADKIILFFYGYANLPAYIALMILIWDYPLLMYTAFCGSLTTSIKREGGAARIYGTEAVLNIVLNIFLIPMFGLIGAAFTTVITELTGAALFYFLFRREFGSGLGLNRILRVVISAALMGIVIYLLRDFSLLVVVPVSGLFYLVIIWLVRVLTPEERGWIQSRVMRRLRPASAA